ncbi:UNVERIFIED_CONTAM: hypothetical protein GTU68_052818 [Idotea baltica]|nr:hypothetical protein [Idotea baltica]
MIDKLEAIVNRFHNVEESLSDPELLSDMSRYKKANKEYKNLKEIVEVYHEYKLVLDNLESSKEMLEDKEMRDMAKEEISLLQASQEKLEEQLKALLIPKDPEDDKDVIFEIRSGAGGDEAAIFAGDLYRMYTKYFETKSWSQEIISINDGAAGGYSKIVIEINGDDVYGQLKFESGAHRVQRVPKTESQGRVHTSAATVVIMPKFEMEDVNITKDQLKVDTFRASGAGGQHVNKTDSGVRFTHIPTGIAAESTDSRSQIKNREIAIQRLYDKIRTIKQARHDSEQADKRKSLVGSGDRSDKIRTYNYPQNRVTDHRINLTLYSLDKVMDGDISTLIEALQVAENAERMQAG